MKGIKKVGYLIGMALLILALVGCSTNTSKSSNSSNTGNSGSASNDAVELVIWHMEEPPNRVARFNEIAQKFNDANSDVKVKFEVQSWDDAYSKFPTAIQAGNGPDLLFAIPDYTTLLKQLNVVQPVDDIIKAINDKHGIYSSALAPYEYEGSTWAIPVFGMVQVLWYRADLLKEKNITPPKTWAELTDAAAQLTEGDKFGIALPASKSMATDQVIYSFLTSGGAKNIINGNNEITFNNPNSVKAYETYSELLNYSPVDSNTFTWGEPQALFNTGKVAMAIEKGQYLATFEAESGRPASDLGVVPMPISDGGEEGSIYYSNGIMLLTDDEKKKAAATKFFEFLFEPEVYGSFVNAEPGLFLPVTETGSQADSYWNDPVISKYKDQVQVLIDASAKGQLFGFTDGIASKIGNIAGPNFIAQTLEQMLYNNMSAADAVSWGQAQMEEAIK